MKLLMHICCAPCAVYPVKTVLQRGIDVHGLWFNPNIHPFTEYNNRLNSLKKLGNLWNLQIEYIDYYGLIEFLRNVSGNEKNRCEYCYKVRLEKTAIKAKEMNFDAFTSTLLVSPFQKFDMLIDLGKLFESKYDIEFISEDFRTGFKKGKKLSREIGLYQQKYCGCIYSELIRYNRNVLPI